MYTTCWQDEADLNIDVQILYIKAGKSEIQNYVNTVTQPSLAQYVTVAQNAANRAAASAASAANSAASAAASATSAANSANRAAEIANNMTNDYYTKQQIDSMIGSISTSLDVINGEVA